MSLTSSVARPADGLSDCTAPDSAPSLPVKSIRGDENATSPTSPASACMTTCEPLALPDFARTGYQLTLWSDLRPARTPAAQTPKAKASTASEQDCSGKHCGWCASCDPVGYALRTCLVSDLAAMTEYTMRWKRQATPSGRSWWVLGTPERRTGGTESGLLPTPRKSDAERGGRGDLIQAVRGNPNRHFTMPTPRCCSGLRSRGVNQTELTRALLPTPTKTEYGSNQGGAAGRTGKVRPSLKTLLTPTKKGNMNSPSMAKWAGSWQGVRGTAELLALVEWMMGFPRAWLTTCLPPTATPSSQSSLKSSDGQL